MVDDSGTSSSKSLKQRKRAATKREVNAIMERPCRSTLSAVTVGAHQDVEVLTEPTHVAQKCCDYGTRRFRSIEPKWFRPHDVAEGHEVYAVVRDDVVEGTVTNIDNDGHYVVRTDEGVAVTCVRSGICHTTVLPSAPSTIRPPSTEAVPTRVTVWGVVPASAESLTKSTELAAGGTGGLIMGAMGIS